MRIVRKSELTSVPWKGGTTTQLFISPPTATYQEFNFDFRMSYATVEVPESTFTFMPGVTRHLLIMEGELDIAHEGHYKKKLNKFDQDVFNGEWPTTARGMVTDFNLMVRNGYEGKLETRILQAGEKTRINLENNNQYTGLYILSGTVDFFYGEKEYVIEAGDFVFFSPAEAVTLSVNGQSFSELVIATVQKPT